MVLAASEFSPNGMQHFNKPSIKQDFGSYCSYKFITT
jgi:hypothetical protein